MTQKLLLVLALLASLGGQPQASAQTADIAEVAMPDRVTGVETAVSQGGFALTTFGVWSSPVRAQPTVLDSLDSPQKGARLKPRRATTRVTHSLRRAIYLPHVSAAEAAYRLPAGLLDALIWTESRYNPLAISRAGAAGLGQLMPKTARHLGVSNRFSPHESVWASARYLRELLDKFGLVELAVAAYNAGPGAVERARGIPLNGETPGYVRSVLRIWGV